MKKIYSMFLMLGLSSVSLAQTVTGGDMESWRTASSGSHVSTPIYAPYGWNSSDSLVIYDGQFYGAFLFIPASAWKAQLFQETAVANVHGGNSSAKLLTLKQDTLGHFPCYMTNSKFNIPISVSASGPTVGTPTYSGGQSVTQRITSVSAYVKYLPGIDSMTGSMGGIDTGFLTVQARGHLHGTDTTVAMTTLKILPSASFTQITANLTYFDTTYTVDTLRMVFASSGGGLTRPLDSSTLYVDDITMTGVPNPDHTGIKNVTSNEVVKVYPNPSPGVIYFSAAQTGLTFALYDVNGKVQASKSINGNGELNVSYLPDGLYFYAIRNEAGDMVQQGKIVESKPRP